MEPDGGVDYTTTVVENPREWCCVEGFASMPKVLSIFGMVVAAFLLLVFGLNLAIGIPFGNDSTAMAPSIGFVVSGVILAYLSWSAFREAA